MLIRIFISQGDGVDYLFSWFKAFFVLTSSCFLSIIWMSKKSAINLLKTLILCYLINAIINLIAGSFPDYFLFLEYFKGVRITDNVSSNPYRNSFISGSGYYSIGTAYGLFILFFAYYLSTNKSQLGFLYLIVLAISATLAARTSMISITLAILLIVSRNPKNILYVLIYTTFAAIIFNLFLPEYVTWTLRFFTISNDPSGEVLLNQMHFWPGENIFLIGNGAINDGQFTYTDSGFMKDILYGGIVFAITKFIFAFYFFVKLYKKYFLLSFFTLISLIGFQMKGAFLYSNAQGMAAFYFIYILLSLNKERKFI